MQGRRWSPALVLVPALAVAIGCTPSKPATRSEVEVTLLRPCDPTTVKPAAAPWASSLDVTKPADVTYEMIKGYADGLALSEACGQKGQPIFPGNGKPTTMRASILPVRGLALLDEADLRAGRIIGSVEFADRHEKLEVPAGASYVWVDGKGKDGALRFVFLQQDPQGARIPGDLFFKATTEQTAPPATWRNARFVRKGSLGVMQATDSADSASARMLVDEAWFRCTSAGCCCTTANCH